MNNSVLGKAMENVNNHRDIKFLRTNCLVSEPNYHIQTIFPDNVLAIEMKRTQILMYKPVYYGTKVKQ